MKEGKPNTIYLSDYKEPEFLIPETNLEFLLDENKTIVKSRLNIKKNSNNDNLFLNGHHLTLKRVAVNEEVLTEDQYKLTNDGLEILKVPSEFVLEIEVEIDPENNKTLEGLYKSNGMFCTQNEPQGFRRITYFLDRSDIMSVYTVKIIADKEKYPILLSNGNLIESGKIDEKKHFAIWNDPFKKPTYLFALVAGDLDVLEDQFVTMSGKTVELKIFCDKGNLNKCYFAMESLKKSMKWDEEVFGLEYDLDIYMIVAVDAFNMGAMENKGLNIFNTTAVLASSETSTDERFLRIQSIVGHEYFHNWTGNRITCRDWFQLTLKEGLTVFRDQEFSADMFSRGVIRIQDVTMLREQQFVEDESPMAHPIRPDSYIEINNFYTRTVYDKGAEIIRMIHTLLGKDLFRKGMDKYFELYDGQAVTCDEFINAMSVVSGRKFDDFMNWYHQSGTPKVNANWQHEGDKYVLTLTQSCPSTPGQPSENKKPFLIPLQMTIFNKNGEEVKEQQIIEFNSEKETIHFEGLEEGARISLNRNFSAPINLSINYEIEDWTFFLKNETDEFNRWEAAQQLYHTIVDRLIVNEDYQIPLSFFESLKVVLNDENIDHALKAEILTLPSQMTLSQKYNPVQFEKIFQSKKKLTVELGKRFEKIFLDFIDSYVEPDHLNITKEQVGKRTYLKKCLEFYSYSNPEKASELVYKIFTESNNITTQLNSLNVLARIDNDLTKKAIDAFELKWKHDHLVMYEWLLTIVGGKEKGVLEKLIEMKNHPIYDPTIPNTVRALYSGLFYNPHELHKSDGKAYQEVANEIKKIDKINPSLASRLSGTFEIYPKLSSSQKDVLAPILKDILAQEGLSKNTYEIIFKTLETAP